MLNIISKKILNVNTIFILVPFLFGLFYNFTVYIVTIVFLVIVLVTIIKNRKLRIYFNICFITVIIMTISSLLTCIWAIDKTDAMFGFFRIFTILLFVIILMQMEEKYKEKKYSLIPISGTAMTIMCIIIRFIPPISRYLYSENGRLGGFFQYSNTFALFLLIGITVLLFKKENVKNKLLQISILLIGIFLTGSRTVFLLTILPFAINNFTTRNKEKWKILLIFISTIIISLLIALITNNFETIGRYLTISINSSTLWGRIIYYKDAIKVLGENIFGYGYMGYSYLYSKVQTANYSVMFVHNDFLQIALDMGIISMLAFVGMITYSIFSKKTSLVQKVVIIIMFLHMLVDFDLQFLTMFLILILMQDLSKQRNFEFKVKKSIISIGIIIILIIWYGYIGIASFMNYINQNYIAMQMLPNYTEAKVQLMKEAKNIDYSNKLANQVLKNNKNISFAYETKALFELNEKNYEKACEYQESAMMLDKYDSKKYEDYIFLISKILDNLIKENDYALSLKYMNKALEVQKIIEKVEKGSTILANKIQDNSSIKLNEETKKYLENIKGVIKNVETGQKNY